MKYVYIFLAIIIIFILSIFTFKEDEIYYYYAKYTTESNEELNNNNYFYIDNFMYLDDYTNTEIHSKEELYNTIYYLVNSGITHTKRYFDINYTNYEEDYSNLFENIDELNIINNFVHPYNSFSSIEASLKGYVLDITIKYNDYYSDTYKQKIDNEVNKVISELITNNMTEKEKVKVIHDYIVNNTTYDENFCVEKTNCTTTSPYASDTAYGVLFEHYGICSGYTDLMAIFLNKLNIINYRITNDTHTWNAVKINNTWYHLDATWDDPINDTPVLSHTYFLITTSEDEKLKEPHIFNKEIFMELS